jgi:hypothetical protein
MPAAAPFFRPTRGAVRLDALRWAAAPMQAELARFPDEAWQTRAYGDLWGDIVLLKPGKDGGMWEHPEWPSCPAIRGIVDSIPSRVLDVTLARLGPGGWVKEHRDISGGIPMGVARFHVPIVTDPGVRFFVSGRQVVMGEGELWNLDTSYRHALRNESQVWRVHLIFDVELNDAVRAMLPPREAADALHRAWFNAICAGKALELAVKNPRQLPTRVRNFVRLRVFKRSVLYSDE